MERINDSFTARPERIVLDWLCLHMPRWVTSDMLTALGVIGAALVFFGYWRSDHGDAYLWLAIFGMALNWFGDSLDGSLARMRHTERPKYGFFLDHMTDTLAMALISLGVGLSPYACFGSGMAVLIGYYVLVILTLTTSLATGVFKISFNGMGPTEIRLFIILFTLCAIAFPTPSVMWREMELTIYDGVMMGLTAVLLGLCLRQTFQTLHELTLEDPPHH